MQNYLNKRTSRTGVPAHGVDIEVGQGVIEPIKTALPINFTKPIVAQPQTEKFDIQITDNTENVTRNYYRFVETSTGAYLLPMTNSTTTVDANCAPITTPIEKESVIANDLPETSKTTQTNEQKSKHCTCCVQLRKICKQRQTTITDYFGKRKENVCSCKDKRYQKVSNRLRLLANNQKYHYTLGLQELQKKIKCLKQTGKDTLRLIENDSSNNDADLDDISKCYVSYLT